MDNARARYFFGNAWRSLASTRNLFGKLCLLALIQFVPILGQIVALGYLLGWAREAAWNMETPLPAHVFGRDDDSFWARGALAFVVCILYAIIQGLVATAIGVVFGLVVDNNPTETVFAVASVATGVVELLAMLLLAAFECIGLVRMAIYNSFGAAFQWGVSCKMIGREFGGLFKLFWTAVLALLVLGILSAIAVSALMPAFVGVGIGVPLAATVVSYGEMTQASAMLLSSVLGASALMSVATLAVGFFVAVSTLLVEAVLWRALGSWVALFDVASWGGRHDGLPFETGTRPPLQAPEAVPAPEEAALPAGETEVAGCAMVAEQPQEPQRRCHPLLVGFGSLGIALLIGLACSGSVAGLAASLYNSGAVQIDVQEATEALREAADEMLYEWESIWY